MEFITYANGHREDFNLFVVLFNVPSKRQEDMTVVVKAEDNELTKYGVETCLKLKVIDFTGESIDIIRFARIKPERTVNYIPKSYSKE